MTSDRSLPRRWALVLFFFSGATGLVYQVVWLRQLTLIFGATAYASSAVLSVFMGGLALGSFWAGRKATSWPPPLRAYGGLELGIAAYASLIPFLLPLTSPLLEIAWRHGGDRSFALLGLIKLTAIVVLILPATTLMGATLPVLSRLAADEASSIGGGVGALYASNTFGAVVGTVFAAFVALPGAGTRRTLAATILLNAGVGLTAWLAGGRLQRKSLAASEQGPPEAPVRPALVPILAIGLSGAAAMVLEVAWTRGLSLVLGSSVYAYASMLTAFLIGLASGAAAAVRFLTRRPSADPRRALTAALGAAGLLSFGTSYALQMLPRLFGEAYFRLNPPAEGWWIVQLVLASVVMFPTTFALGWVFPLVLQSVGGGRATVAAAVGRVYASNTLGTIVGAIAGGFLFVPTIGVARTVVAVAAVQLLIAAIVAAEPGPRRRVGLAMACAVAALGCVLLRPGWDILLMNSGVYMNAQDIDRDKGWKEFLRRVRNDNDLVYAQDGLTASVVVANQPKANNLYLAVNGKTDASSRSDLETQIAAGQIPLLLHPSARDVLVVGLASGITAGSVATHPSVERLRIVEVESVMIGAARCFREHNGDVLDDPRVTLSINDARNELQFNPATYDVIISEPSNPWMTVAANLFTEDFFRIARTRLRPGGVFGQWIQAYCLGPAQVRSILAAFRKSFPSVLVFETLQGADFLVVGSDRPLSLDLSAIDEQLREFRVRVDLERIGVRSAIDIAGMLQTGGTAVDRLADGAQRNTDDNGYVEFTAPRTLYLDSEDANLAMLQGHDADPVSAISALVRTDDDPSRFRLEIARRWVLRGHADRARNGLTGLSDPELQKEAAALLSHPE